MHMHFESTSESCGAQYIIICNKSCSNIVHAIIFQYDKSYIIHSCVLLFPIPSLFSKLLCDSAVRRKYLLLITNSFVLDHPSIKWCPAPGCDNAVLANSVDNNPVHCSCGHGFW